MQFFKASPKNLDGVRIIQLPDSPLKEEQLQKIVKHSPTVKDRSAHELLLKDQIITVIEKYPIIDNSVSSDKQDTIAVG